MSIKKRNVSVIAGIFFLMICLFAPVSADADSKSNAQENGNSAVTWNENSMPAASDNTVINLRKKSYLTPVPEGYMRVIYTGTDIVIEYYDEEFGLIRQGSMPLELNSWGGFFAGKDGYYYIAQGQSNKEEEDSAEVIRVIKYDSEWNRIGAASITGNRDLFGGKVRTPFQTGSVNMTEVGGTLYLVTGHEGYVDAAVGQGHQGFLLIAIDESTMTGKIIKSDLWHSFAQYIMDRDSDLYVLEQSEGDRCTQLSCYSIPERNWSSSFSVLDYGGTATSAWAIPCYASVDDLAISSDHVLGLGTSIDQSQYDNITENTAHNIYLTITPISNCTKEATTVKWLTDNKENGKAFIGTNITKVNENRFLVSWEEYFKEESGLTDQNDTLSFGKLHYVFVDGAGNVISDEFVVDAVISDCKPILNNGSIVYCASNANMVDFYSVDATTGAFDKKTNRVAGPCASWNYESGTLSFSGTGAITIDINAVHRRAVSSVSGFYSYSSRDNAWKNLRNGITEIHIGNGITSIQERAFAWFDKLSSVDLSDGMKSIGKEAFYSCGSLQEIRIPESVDEIGDDFLWTGSYRTSDRSHVTRTKIIGRCTAYAIQYAKANKIKYDAEHSFGDYIVKKPTCEEDGYNMHVCTACKEEEKEILNATGHKYGDSTLVKEATCTEEGYWERTCSVCGKTDREIDEATGHDWDPPEYKWSKDYSKVTAIRVCFFDEKHKEKETVKTTSEISEEATPTNKGAIVYTAKFDNPAFDTQTKKVKFKFKKLANPMTAKASKKTIKKKALKKKSVAVKSITVENAKGTVSYKIVKANAKSKKVLTLSAKNGKITVRKGTKKGTYTIKVRVTASGTATYNSTEKSVTATIVVK